MIEVSVIAILLMTVNVSNKSITLLQASQKLCFVYNKAISMRHQQRLDLMPYLIGHFGVGSCVGNWGEFQI